jgi:hypothetical protein
LATLILLDSWKKSQTFATATAVKNNELGLFTTGI